jgi:hypothetical protein
VRPILFIAQIHNQTWQDFLNAPDFLLISFAAVGLWLKTLEARGSRNEGRVRDQVGRDVERSASPFARNNLKGTASRAATFQKSLTPSTLEPDPRNLPSIFPVLLIDTIQKFSYDPRDAASGLMFRPAASVRDAKAVPIAGGVLHQR